MPGTSQRRALAGSILVDPNVDWYLDASPVSQAYFSPQQTLLRDPSAVSVAFDGSPPQLLEVAYASDANPLAPAEALGNFDLFTTMQHEIAHVIGLSGALFEDETGIDLGPHPGPSSPDNDVDINPDFVDGNVFSCLLYTSDAADE